MIYNYLITVKVNDEPSTLQISGDTLVFGLTDTIQFGFDGVPATVQFRNNYTQASDITNEQDLIHRIYNFFSQFKDETDPILLSITVIPENSMTEIKVYEDVRIVGVSRDLTIAPYGLSLLRM